MCKLLQYVGFSTPTVTENKWQPLGHPFWDNLRSGKTERELAVVVLGLYVFFHHEGDIKDGGT